MLTGQKVIYINKHLIIMKHWANANNYDETIGSNRSRNFVPHSASLKHKTFSTTKAHFEETKLGGMG